MTENRQWSFPNLPLAVATEYGQCPETRLEVVLKGQVANIEGFDGSLCFDRGGSPTFSAPISVTTTVSTASVVAL